MSYQRGRGYRGGYTLRELLAVAVIIVILLMLAAGYASKSWRVARRTNCMSNMRQVSAGIFQYAADNDGRWPNCDQAVIQQGLGTGTGGPAQTFPYLTQYVGDPRVFHCPEDPRSDLRTYAINDYLGGLYWSISHVSFVHRVVNAPSVFMLIEEQAPPARNGYLGGFVVLPAPITRWADAPGILHDNKGTCLAFADGHVEYWIWQDPRTLKLPQTPFPNTPSNPDLLRLQQAAGSVATTVN